MRIFWCVEFIDGDGNILVPKAVRPIIDLKETLLGSKKGAKKQFRYGNLHIREYDTYYSVHVDKVNPLSSPLGHLLIDAPEYFAGATAEFITGRHFGTMVYDVCKKEGKNTRNATLSAIIAGYVAGSVAGNIVFNIATHLKKKRSG
jgi:hypothetical protein